MVLIERIYISYKFFFTLILKDVFHLQNTIKNKCVYFYLFDFGQAGYYFFQNLFV